MWAPTDQEAVDVAWDRIWKRTPRDKGETGIAANVDGRSI